MTILARKITFPASGGSSWLPGQGPIWRGGEEAQGGRPETKAILQLDFAIGRYAAQGVEVALAAAAATTRSSSHFLVDADGVLQTFGVNTLARLAGVGADVGSQFTNKIRNPRGEGATAGVVGAGGALPTYWAVTTSAGLSTEVRGSGVENGLPYVELRISGTATSTTDYELVFENSSNATLTAGDAWGHDLRVRSVAGSPIPVRCAVQERNNGTLRRATAGLSVTPTGAIARLQSAAIVTGVASSNNVRPALLAAVTSGNAYDFTLRLHAPKLVQLAVITGSELVTPGTAVCNTGWSENAGGLTASAASLYAKYPASGLDGKTVKIAYRIASYSVGAVRAVAYGASNNQPGTSYSATGTYTEYLSVSTAGGSNPNTISFQAYPSAFTGTIDQVSAKILSPGHMPDFPILPPAGTPGDATKFADDVKAIASGSEPFAGFAAAGLGSGLSMLAAVNLSHVGDGAARPIAEVSDGTTGNRLRFFIDSDDRPAAAVVSGGTTLATVKLAGALTVGQAVLLATYDPASGLRLLRKAGLEAASASLAGVPSGLTTMRIGSSASSAYFNDFIERIDVFAPLTQDAAIELVQVA